MGAITWGYVLPSSGRGDVPEPADLWPLVEAADRSLDYLWVSDHILWWHPMYESVTLLSALAARTQRVKLGTAVLLLAMRNPVIIAKELATIDRLSEGRLTVGVGVGGEFEPEWNAAGVSLRSRAARTDEMIEALRGMWIEEEFETHGRHVDLDALSLHPHPAAPPPIWVGGRSDAALRRAARLGDGWMGIWLTADRFRERAARLAEEMEQAGADEAEFERSIYVWASVAKRGDEARAQAAELLGDFYNLPFEKLEKYSVVGTPKECADQLQGFVDAGATNIALAPIVSSPDLSQFELLLEAVEAARG